MSPIEPVNGEGIHDLPPLPIATAGVFPAGPPGSSLESARTRPSILSAKLRRSAKTRDGLLLDLRRGADGRPVALPRTQGLRSRGRPAAGPRAGQTGSECFERVGAFSRLPTPAKSPGEAGRPTRAQCWLALSALAAPNTQCTEVRGCRVCLRGRIKRWDRVFRRRCGGRRRWRGSS
jgi:hypothetical protein